VPINPPFLLTSQNHNINLSQFRISLAGMGGYIGVMSDVMEGSGGGMHNY